MLTKTILKLAAVVIAASGLSACGVVKSWLSWGDASNLQFAQEIPESVVSVAWRDLYGQVWVVPKRGVLVEAMRNASGPVRWNVQGSYLVALSGTSELELRVDGRWWKLSLPEVRR